MIQFLITAIRDTGPIAYIALGAVFAFRARVFHLGLEGLMAIGAFAAVAGTVATGSVLVGIALAIVVCALLSVLFWWVITKLRAHVIIAGLGLTTVGVALSAFAQEVIFDTKGTVQAGMGLLKPLRIAPDSPWVSASSLSILVWLLPVAVFAVWLVTTRSRFGLQLSAVGDYPFAARSAGVSVDQTKLWALLICGVFCALGGVELALGSLQQFTPGMVSGRGFIGFTAVIFGASHPIGSALASLFFGASEALGVSAQLQKWPLPLEAVLATPYVLTIVAVTVSGLIAKRTSGGGSGFSELADG